MSSLIKRLFRGFVATILAATALQAFDPITDDSGVYVVVWERGEVEFYVNLDRTTVLSDGFTQADSFLNAINDWNAQLGNVQFSVIYSSVGAYSLNNGVNEVAMDDTIGGFEFDANTLAVTVSFVSATQSNYREHADVVFNSAWDWDSYRGPLREQQDIRRVALHEFGHVIGLTHPDQATPPQAVVSIMNSQVSDVDSLTQDDIAGGHFLYGAPDSIPANDDFANATEIILNGEGEASVTGTSTQSSMEDDEPGLNLSAVGGGRTVWWKWTATESAYMQVTTMGSSFDTLLGVYTGDSLGLLRERGTNDDVEDGVVRTSEVRFTALAGVTYYFQVDGWSGYEGHVQLNLEYEIPPGPAVEATQSRIVGTQGELLTLSVQAEAAMGGALGYQWFKDSTPIAGATESELTFSTFANADAGRYHVEVTETGGGRAYGLVFVVPDYAATSITQVVTRATYSEPPTSVAELSDVIQVAAGNDFGLALRRDGTVVGWRMFDYGNEPAAATVPDGLSDVVAIAAGYYHALALKANGTVVAWGGNDAGQAEVPVDLYNVVQISAGTRHSVALRADGSVTVWGAVDNGEAAAVPAGLGPVQSISAQGSNTLVLKADGAAYSWSTSYASKPPLYSNLIQVQAHSNGGIALSEAKQLVRWGDSTSLLKVVPDGIVRVYAGWYDVALLLPNGELRFYGQYSDFPPGSLAPLTRVVDASLHRQVAVVLRDVSTVEPPHIAGVEGPAKVGAGEPLQLVARVWGGAGIAYQWYRNGTPLSDDERISGATSANLRIDPTDLGDDGNYQLYASTSAGGAYSSNQAVTIGSAPTFTQRPLSKLAWVGDTVEFQAEVASESEVSYVWTHNGEEITPQGDTLRLNPVSLADRGRYTVTATNANGATRSYFWLHVSMPGAEAVTWDQSEVSREASLAKTHGGFAKVVAESSAEKGVALGLDGRLVRWGEWGTDVPPWENLVDVIAFTSGDLVIGLKADGTVVGAGTGLVSVPIPAGLTEIVSIAGDGSRFSAQRADGSVEMWRNFGDPVVPRPNRDIVMQAGPNAFLTREGRPMGSGLGNYPSIVSDAVYLTADGALALLGDGTVLVADLPHGGYLPNGLHDVVRLADGVALQANGELVVWHPNGGITGGNIEQVPSAAGGAFEVGSHTSAGLAHRYWALVPGTGTSLLLNSAPTGLVAGDEALLRVDVFADLPVTYQWLRNGVAMVNSDRINGVDGPVLRIDAVSASDTDQYSVRVTTSDGTLVSPVIDLQVALLPTISQHPQSASLQVGDSVKLSVVASDDTQSYQWEHDGAEISGATSSSLWLTDVQLDDAGLYTVVIANGAGSVRSEAAVITVAPPPPVFEGSHEVTHDDQTPGGSVTILNRFTADVTIESLRWSVLLPENWTLAEWDGPAASVEPTVGSSSLLEWEWNSAPGLPHEFTYVLNSPTEAGSSFQLAATFAITAETFHEQGLVAPDPLILRQGFHSADIDGNMRLSLSELLRVIELYNTRAGTTRTGRYRLSASTADGFDPDTRSLDQEDRPTRYHSADFDHDGRLSLTELLRVIELYNTRSGTTRTGGYRVDGATMDGFAPDS